MVVKEGIPVVMDSPAKSTETVKAVQCFSVCWSAGTIGGSLRDDAISSLIGQQMMPLVSRIIIAICSTVTFNRKQTRQ